MNRFPESLLALKDKILLELRPRFDQIDATALQNTARILDAYRNHKVSDYDFRQTTGYGYSVNGSGNNTRVETEAFHREYPYP